jgi:hypothetical protein
MGRRHRCRGTRLLFAMGAVALCGACTLLTSTSGLSDARVEDGGDAQQGDAQQGNDGPVSTTEEGGGSRDAASELIEAASDSASCPCSFFGDTFSGSPSTSDNNDVEIGIRFTSDVPAKVIAIRFYKGPTNTGTHTGSLWSASGALLGTGTFADETATGWQTLMLPTPVPIQANTPYVASYHTTTGGYATTSFFFANGFATPPLRATSDNGLFIYNSNAVPTEVFNFNNYWVDVVIQSAQ